VDRLRNCAGTGRTTPSVLERVGSAGHWCCWLRQTQAAAGPSVGCGSRNSSRVPLHETPRVIPVYDVSPHRATLWCIDCNGIVPLYRLPPSSTGEHSELLSWKSNYRACDALQMNCTVGERFGKRQTSDLASELSRSGLAVCRDLKRLTGRPVYYYLYRESTRSHSVELRRKCPNCGGPWRLQEPLHGKFDFKCDKCRLLSNIAWSAR
jgi:hypothetical protein